jgi:hypothetical protein
MNVQRFEVPTLNRTREYRNATALARRLQGEGMSIDNVQIVRIIPTTTSKLFRCFQNADDFCMKSSGWDIVFGWSILPSVHSAANCDVFTFEHHCIVRRFTDGKLIDVTPDHEGHKEKLFIPDPVLCNGTLMPLGNPFTLSIKSVQTCKYCRKFTAIALGGNMAPCIQRSDWIKRKDI